MEEYHLWIEPPTIWVPISRIAKALRGLMNGGNDRIFIILEFTDAQ